MLEHTNKIAIKILSEEHFDYRVKPENRWHYDIQYKMLVKAIELSRLSENDLSECVCNEEDKHGWTTVKCCNKCGLSIEPFWRKNN